MCNRLKIGIAISFGLSLMAVVAHGQEEKLRPGGPAVPIAERLASLHLLEGPWNQSVVHGESVLFVRAPGGKPSAKLLFDAAQILTVRSADGKQTYEAERDYQIAKDGSGLELTPNSRIRSINETDLFRPKGSPNSIGFRAGHPETSVLFDNGHYFHDLQVEVSYVPRDAKWKTYKPAFAKDGLSGTIDKLSKRQPITIAVSGDSISEGYNASAYIKVAPFQPTYSALVAAQLEQTYGSKVTHHNLAIAGWSSAQGLNDLEDLLKKKPDLILIAYGMNDVGGRNPAAFRANIGSMLKRIKAANPATEVILIASMTGNPDWMATPAEMFPKYRDALASLQGPGVVLADVTSVWIRMLERKRHTDLTGNGVNHPNDYGHRLYAQTILGLMVDPALVARSAEKPR